MDLFEHLKSVYAAIRQRDNHFDMLISEANEKCREEKWAIHRDMGFSTAEIDAFFASDINNYYEESQVVEYKAHSTVIPNHDADNSDDNKTLEGLAKRLRSCCDPHGREMLRNLSESANCLILMGRIYILRGMQSCEMEQKLHFIRAAVLVNAAIVRYSAEDNIGEYVSSIEVLAFLHQQLLRASSSQVGGNNFILLSSDIKCRLENLRKRELATLSKVKRMRTKQSPCSDTELVEIAVINEIREIVSENSRTYRSFMADIAKECLEVMGKPPCEFAIAGLGSLAREEITLSSDFEHVILLKDGTPDSSEIKEYFRWFTIIFHVIIIGLGETIVPSVDIDYICDHYSYDKKKNWFKDYYTPCGISFDGMMPHACKCPLGRQRPTKKFNNTVELIQTASGMAKFLTREEQIKDGYMLHDVLSVSCFVYGSKGVYDKFVEKCAEIRRSFNPTELFEQHRYLLTDLVKNWKSSRTAGLQFVDVKKSVYRPITVLLHFLAVIFDLPSRSSLGIVDDLRNHGIINDESHHALSYSVAIALELRMRCYQTKHGQRNVIINRDICKMVGKECAVHYRVTILTLLRAVRFLAYRKFQEKSDVSYLVFPTRIGDIWNREVALSSFYFNENYGEVIEDSLSSIRILLSRYTDGQLSTSKAKYFIETYVELLSDSLRCLIQNDAFCSHNRELLVDHDLQDMYFWSCYIMVRFGIGVSTKINFLCDQCYLLFHRERYREARDLLEKSKKLCMSSKGVDKEHLNPFIEFEVKLIEKMFSADEAVQYCRQASQASELTAYQRCLYKIGIGQSLLQKGDTESGTKLLQNLISDLTTNSFDVSKDGYSKLLRLISEVFGKSGNLGYSINVLELRCETLDMKIVGSYPAENELFVNIHLTNDYRYNFGPSWNVGKYANYTYNSLQLQRSLARNMQLIKYSHSLQIFSSVSYEDMITMIKYTLGDVLGGSILVLPGFPELWKHTQTIALLALCECVKVEDFELFGKLIGATSHCVRAIKLLQPFLYATFKEYTTRPEADFMIVSSQRDIFRGTFSTVLTNEKYMLPTVVSKFMKFEFETAAKITWRGLHCAIAVSEEHNVSDSITELFLTIVMTVIIAGKRSNPDYEMRNCRELSLKQSVDGSVSSCRIEESVRFYLISKACIILLSSPFAEYSIVQYGSGLCDIRSEVECSFNMETAIFWAVECCFEAPCSLFDL